MRRFRQSIGFLSLLGIIFLTIGCQPVPQTLPPTITATNAARPSATSTHSPLSPTPTPIATTTPSGPGHFVGTFGAGSFSGVFRSPNGVWVFAIINKKEVRWYDAKTLQQQGSLILETSWDTWPNEMIFGPDENLVAITGYRRIWLLGMKEQKILHSIDIGGDYIQQPKFFQDSKYIIYRSLHPTSGRGYAALNVWSANDENFEISKLDCKYSEVGLSPDGTLIAIGCNHQIKLWEEFGKRKSWALDGHDANINTVVFSADNNLFASGDENGNVYVWDRKTLKHISSFSLTGSIAQLTFTNKDQQIQVTLKDQLPQIIDLKTNQIQPTPAKEKDIDPLEWALYHQGYIERPFFSPFTIDPIAISPNQKLLAVAGQSILLWDIESKQLVSVLENKTRREVRKLYFDPTGQFIAGPINNQEVLLWDTTKKIEQNTPAILSDSIKDCSIYDCGNVVYADDCWANCPKTAFSPDGKLLALSREKTIALWGTQTAKKLAALPIFQDQGLITALQFSKDGQFLYVLAKGSTSPNDEIQVWNISTRQMIHQIKVPMRKNGQYYGEVLDWPWLAFTVHKDTTTQGIGLWNAETQVLKEFNIGEYFSPQGFDQSGELLVIDSLCNTPYILQIEMSKFLYQFSNTQFGDFSQLANSNFVVSGGQGMVDLWDISDILHSLKKPNITPLPSPTYLPCSPG